MKQTTVPPTLKRRPADFLQDLYQIRKARNPAYTIRAFARDVGISSSQLSRIFSGTRPITLNLAHQIASVFALNENESTALIYSVVQSSSKTAKISKRLRARLEHQMQNAKSDEASPLFTSIEIERFKAMASWYHLAILNLVNLDNFDADPIWIARQLGISSVEARDAVQRLLSIGLLTEEGLRLKRTVKNFYVRTQRSEVAVRNFHEQMISKACETLKQTSDADFQRRVINGITFSCGDEHIETIKEKIDRLQDEILALTDVGTKTAVYQMNVQFFPLTKTTSEKKEI